MNIKTKFNIHDTIWFMNGSIPVSDKITGITTSTSYLSNMPPLIKYMTLRRPDLDESKCFKSKQALLRSL